MLEANSKRANEKMKKQGTRNEDGEEKINAVHIKTYEKSSSPLQSRADSQTNCQSISSTSRESSAQTTQAKYQPSPTQSQSASQQSPKPPALKSQKTIKLKIVDWWDAPSLENFNKNYFVRLLRRHYDIEPSENPDYLLYSILGQEHLKYDCIRIFHTQEQLAPDFNIADYALGFDYLTFLDRYMRLPHFALDYYHEDLRLSARRHELDTKTIESKHKFCSFVVSNPYGEGPRDEFFEELCRYKKVDSGGRWKNNIGGPIDSIYSHCAVPFWDFPRLKRDFISQYKFHLCFENVSSPGYLTEKLWTAFAAGTLPIYWGDPSLLPGAPFFADSPGLDGRGDYVINPKAYINVHAFANMHEAIAYIKEVDSDKNLYLSLMKERVFLQDYDLIDYYEAKTLSFFDSIFARGAETRRRSGFNVANYERTRHDYAHLSGLREGVNSLVPRPIRPLLSFNKYHRRYYKRAKKS